ncbi:hypothetical protein [Hymenobacter sp. DG25A]|uniref:hypothetical protein n=1 Tax=Hymenobacter sp. DG25A TaxID=1385663 RepID=UPI0006BD4F0B|nr:hypothetical protein [Hymenobacter sp. DG25A]ALD20017.1 hypothetical protein AM218_00720 [Hymenobacter sp. DG25A]
MKSYIQLLLLATLSLLGCRKTDVEPTCSGSCTIIKGRYVTDDGAKGIAGMPVEVQWKNQPSTYNIIIRRKAATKTDANGYYKLRFFIKDDELQNGYFRLVHTLHSKAYVNDHSIGGAQFDGLTRDTTIINDWLLPRKAFIKLEVSNPTQAASPYYAYTSFNFNIGAIPNPYPESWYKIVMPWRGAFTTTVEVAANQPIDIETLKEKNSISTRTHDTIRLAPEEVYTLKESY